MSGPTSEDSPSAGPVTAVRATSDAASIDEARAEGSAADESFAADVDSGHDLVRERMVALRRRPDPVVRDLILGRIFGEEHRSATIGRFTIVGKIGAGAMGVVYEAIDPQLGRHVALKVLQADDTDPTAQARLLREARAIAMVSHPNVITVYEAGDVGGQVYLAMERVHGASLDAWLAPADGRRRSTREILEVFIAAGRGLAAAHAAGIIHRDFKPSNVMVGDDGRVRVLDFGLARDDASTATDELVTTGRDQGRDRWPPALALTRTGALLGTPAYMAPEQHRGEPATEQSDLFSFCVALYEAIYGQHPFPCHSYAALREAVLTGRVREAPRIRGVPAWLRRALSRGLALDPGARPSSMIDLLRHLDRRRSSAVVRAAIGAGVMTTLIGIGLAAHTLMRPASLTIDVRGRGRPIAGATVLLDGVALSTAEEGARAEVAAGVHGVEIAAEGYRRASRAIELERGDNRHLEVALEREQGRFTLDVEPAGSLVTIDGVDHGSRLRAVAVDTGAHALLIRRDGYHDHRLQWEARTDELREGYVSLAPALPWSRRVDDHNERLEVLGDVDGDGLDDVLVERTKELVAVDPRRDRDLWRLTPVDHYDGGAWLQDLDRDGVKDVIIVDHGGGAAALEAWSSAARGPSAAPRRLWRVSGAGRASEANKPTTIHVDVDGDGDVDVVTAWLDDRRLEAFEAHTGRRLWRAAAAEASIDDLKLARDREGRPVILGATARGAFAADARDGATRWIVDSAGASPRASRPSPRHDLHEVDPTDASESAYFTRPRTPASAVLERIDADGARRWSVEVPSPCTTVDAAAPGGGPLLFCVAGSELVVVDGERGEPLWRRTPASGPVPRLLLPLVGAPPRVVTSHPRGAAILDPSDGRELAVIDLESPSPVMTRHDWDGDGHDELVFSTEAGTVEAVDEVGRRVGSAAVGMRVRRLVPLGDLDRDGLAELGLVSDGGFAHLEGPRTAWIRRTQKGIRATPRIADFDGDGRREIAVAATLDQREAIVLLDLESGREVGRAPDIGHDLIRPPALVPGPRGLELLYADRLNRGVVRYDPIRGEFTASSPGIRSFASPAIADLDGDGGDEAVIVGWYATTPLSIFDADTLDLLWTFALPDGAWAGPIVASPPTAPERPRIVLALNNGDLLVLDAAARRTLWSRPFGRHDVAPAVADLDGDGALDLLVAHVTDNRADLVRLDLESGDELWSRADAGALKARPIVGDVDGDGVLEIVSVSERDGAVVLGVDGRERWRYRPSPGAPAQPAASASPVLVDLDGDGRRELLTAFDGAGLHVLDSATGALRWRYAIDEAATIEAEPIAVDVDGDGVDEIVIADRGGSIALVRGIRGAGAR